MHPLLSGFALSNLLITVAVSALVTFLSIPVALRLGITDAPAALKIHTKSVPRFGGLGIFAGLCLGVLLMPSRYHPVLIGASLIFLVGAIDDRWNITPVQKLGGQAVAGIALWYTVFAAAPGTAGLLFGAAGFALALILSNAVNLIDGMNGLAAGNGFLIFALLSVLEALHGLNPGVTAVMAASILGFLPLNFPRARVFMGDSGSLVIGFMLAYTLTRLLSLDITWFVCGVIVAIVPIFDLALGMLRRVLTGRPLFSADRGHFYDRVSSVIKSDVLTVLITYLATLGFAALALGLSLAGRTPTVVAAAVIALALWAAARALGWLQAPPEPERISSS